ncbi:MAG: ParB/RepB/Spo0J family partition protein [Propionibacteriaceae bacterium]|jgi:ParB family chromosome partitioning protein|nr:ParB/RepB/Spo0J family partition protein [Propionibacteriaceae bacterium]
MAARPQLQLREDAGRSTGLVGALTTAKRDDAASLPTRDLRPNPLNPAGRAAAGEDLDRLTASIRAHGVIQPLVVVPAAEWAARAGRPAPDGAQWVVMAGNRRLAAAVVAGLDEVPIIVRTDLAGQDAAVTLHENSNRLELTPIEEARAFRAIIESGVSQTTLAEQIGLPQSAISKRLALLQLPAAVQDLVQAGRLAWTHAWETRGEPGEALDLAAKTAGDNAIRDWPWAVTRAAREIEQERTRRQTAAEALATGDPFMEPAAVEARFGPRWREREINGPAAVAAARAAGELVVTTSPWGDAVHLTVNPPDRPTVDETDQERARRAGKARDARWPWLLKLVASEPTAERWRRMTAAVLVSRGRLDAQTARLVVKIGAALQDPALTADDPNEWERSLASLADGGRAHAAWAIALASAETDCRQAAVAASPATKAYLALLAEVGHTPAEHDLELSGEENPR